MPKKEEFNGYIPTELIEAIKNNKCILFVGAGLSSKVVRTNKKNLPTWGGLLEELLGYCVHNRILFSADPNDIREMISKGNYIMAAQELQETITLKDFHDFAKLVFKDKNVKPTSTHLLLPKIPFRSIMTSNYDNLIEGAYTLANNGILPTKFTQDDLLNISSPLRSDDFYIFKMHGDIERPSTMILGSRDYQKLLFKTPEYRQFIETLFSVYTFLFIGFGASDPDLDNTLEKLSSLFERTIDKHFILLPTNKFNFTERKRLLLDKRLEVIEYEVDSDHSQVELFIEELSNRLSNTVKPNKSGKKYDIFFSHSSKDETISRRIIDRLKEGKFIVWNYEKNFIVGTDWHVSLDVALNESRVVIFLITENYTLSPWLEKELSLALLKQIEGKLQVIPILYGNVNAEKIPSELTSKLYFRMNPDNIEYDVEKLLQILQLDK